MTRDEFSSLALSYLGELTAYARRLTRTEWDADDLVQAAYQRAFEQWSSLSDPARCRAWLFRIARNLHIDRTRATQSRSELRLVDRPERAGPERAVAPEVIERLEARDLDAMLARLAPEQRESILLCDLWGFRYREIAEITEVPVGTVRSRIARGRALLIDILAAAESSARPPSNSDRRPTRPQGKGGRA